MKSQITNAPETTLQSVIGKRKRFLLLKPIRPKEDIEKFKGCCQRAASFCSKFIFN